MATDLARSGASGVSVPQERSWEGRGRRLVARCVRRIAGRPGGGQSASASAKEAIHGGSLPSDSTASWEAAQASGAAPRALECIHCPTSRSSDTPGPAGAHSVAIAHDAGSVAHSPPSTEARPRREGPRGDRGALRDAKEARKAGVGALIANPAAPLMALNLGSWVHVSTTDPVATRVLAGGLLASTGRGRVGSYRPTRINPVSELVRLPGFTPGSCATPCTYATRPNRTASLGIVTPSTERPAEGVP